MPSRTCAPAACIYRTYVRCLMDGHDPSGSTGDDRCPTQRTAPRTAGRTVAAHPFRPDRTGRARTTSGHRSLHHQLDEPGNRLDGRRIRCRIMVRHSRFPGSGPGVCGRVGRRPGTSCPHPTSTTRAMARHRLRADRGDRRCPRSPCSTPHTRVAQSTARPPAPSGRDPACCRRLAAGDQHLRGDRRSLARARTRPWPPGESRVDDLVHPRSPHHERHRAVATTAPSVRSSAT